MFRLTRHIPTLTLLLAGACADLADPSSEVAAPIRESVAGPLAVTSAALAIPPGVQPGEPYRWLIRRWRSPLGLEVARYGVAIDAVPVYGVGEVEVRGGTGQLVHRAGSGDAVLAELHARGAAAFRRWQHPRGSLARRTGGGDPLAHRAERAVWHYAAGALSPAVLDERVDLRGPTPVGEAAVTDAVTAAVLSRHSLIYELGGPAGPDYLVYARPDGRPWTSPLGNTSPHPTGVPDGRVPPPVPQDLHDQRAARHALADPWLPAGATSTSGNNVKAFFDSLIDANGIFVDFFNDDGSDSFVYGPEPDLAAGDFFAHPTAGRFAFPYDPTNTVNEYFQDGIQGEPMASPDPGDVALNAKIVETFYAANWLHDVFYRAGFDEVAGVAQQSNYGRGGIEGDPLLVHAGFDTTFTVLSADGETSVLDLGLNVFSASRRDQGIDFSTMSHEWGHYMIGRLAGNIEVDGDLGNLQGSSLHEGIADFVSVLVNYNDGDDPHRAFPVGAYGNLDYIESRPELPPEEAPADAMYFGIRRYPYSLDPAKNPLTLRHLAEPPPADQPYYNWKGRGASRAEVHTAGEVFSEALFSCFGNIALAHPDARFDHNRDRMAAYLVAGLAALRSRPSMLDARDAILAAIRFASPFEDYPACRAGFASRGMGAGALGPDREFGSGPDEFPDSYDPADIVESYVDADRALAVTGAVFAPAAAGAPGSIRMDLRNTGLVELRGTELTIRPAIAGAASFPAGRRARLAALDPEDVASASVAVAVDPCRLPPDPAAPGVRAFDYTVEAMAPGRQPIRVEAAFHTAVSAAACGTAQ